MPSLMNETSFISVNNPIDDKSSISVRLPNLSNRLQYTINIQNQNMYSTLLLSFTHNYLSGKISGTV